MYVTHCPMVIHSRSKCCLAMTKNKLAVARTRSHAKIHINPYKFDFEVKGQRRIRNINVRDTFSHRQSDSYIRPTPTPELGGDK